MELLISIIGAFAAVGISILSAYFARKNDIKLQTRKLKEAHYINYISSLHNLATDNNNIEYQEKHFYYRDHLMLVGSEEVIRCILKFEQAVEENSKYNEALTKLIFAIRKDLGLKNKEIPTLYFKKATKY